MASTCLGCTVLIFISVYADTKIEVSAANLGHPRFNHAMHVAQLCLFFFFPTESDVSTEILAFETVLKQFFQFSCFWCSLEQENEIVSKLCNMSSSLTPKHGASAYFHTYSSHGSHQLTLQAHKNMKICSLTKGQSALTFGKGAHFYISVYLHNKLMVTVFRVFAVILSGLHFSCQTYRSGCIP